MAAYPVDVAVKQALAIGAALRLLRDQHESAFESFEQSLLPKRVWPLALLLAGWYLVRSGREPEWTPAILDLHDKSEGIRIIFQLFDRYRDVLEPATQQAYEAKESWDIAGAGGTFQFAAKKIKLSLLETALRSTIFAEATAALEEAAPPPSDLEDRLWAELGEESPTPKASGSGPSRSEVAPLPPSAQTPDLSDEDRCRIVLKQLGHDADTIERLCAGPRAKAIANTSTPVGDRSGVSARLDDAIAAAKQQGKGLIVRFGSTWSGPFEEWNRRVWNSPAVQQQKDRFLTVSYDLDQGDGAEAAMRLRVTAVPTFVLLGGRGQELGRIVGLYDARRFADFLALV